ncbi:antiterminator Q family protein, partial [Escherichia coli]|uniref:antiterminator Q family protein n=1 Tax=Escherichia coli TaxID=562 RepID=UPI0026E53328
MRDIQMVLERWGAWVANNHEDVEWSSVAAGFKGLIPSKVKSRPQCSDDDGLIIREGANKQVISSQADSLIKISRIWADFFPAN